MTDSGKNGVTTTVFLFCRQMDIMHIGFLYHVDQRRRDLECVYFDLLEETIFVAVTSITNYTIMRKPCRFLLFHFYIFSYDTMCLIKG